MLYPSQLVKKFTYCPNYKNITKKQKTKFWSALISSLSYFERSMFSMGTCQPIILAYDLTFATNLFLIFGLLIAFVMEILKLLIIHNVVIFTLMQSCCIVNLQNLFPIKLVIKKLLVKPYFKSSLKLHHFFYSCSSSS